MDAVQIGFQLPERLLYMILQGVEAVEDVVVKGLLRQVVQRCSTGLSSGEPCLENRSGPVIAASDYMRAFPEQVRPHISQRFLTLGTDGFGRSDTRANLREFFEVNRHHVVIAALKALADEGTVATSKVSEAIKKYGINTEKAVPWVA